MHVAAVVAGFEPKSGGGYTFEREILGALKAAAASSSHRFTVLCSPSAKPALSEMLMGSGVSVEDIPRVSGRLGRMMFRELEVVRAHWRRPSDIDRVASKLGVQFVWFLSAQPDRTDMPYMTVVWDLQHRATPWFPEMSASGIWDARDAVHRWFLQRASKVITGTDVGAAQITNFFQVPAENILKLPHPTPSYATNAPALDASAEILPRLGLTKPFVLYPAQFWPHKNHVNLLLAIAQLKREGLAVSIALPGSDKGNRAFVMELAAREGIFELVHPLGFVGRDELVALYRHALALTYVSWCGPENLPPLEAFALGCPVLASRIPGADEQFANAALFCEPGDPSSIADGIRKIYGDADLRARLIQAGHIRAKRFAPANYVGAVIAYMDEFETVRRCWP
jgi:glycosyltransferase involved in cell wall biosynthesis